MFDAAEPNLQKSEPNYRDNNVEEHGKMVATGGKTGAPGKSCPSLIKMQSTSDSMLKGSVKSVLLLWGSESYTLSEIVVLIATPTVTST